MGKFARSWALMKASAGVLRAEKSLLVFPLLSGLCTLVVAASFLVPVAVMAIGGHRLGIRHEHGLSAASWTLLFLFYLAYMALRGAIDDEAKGARAGAILALVGLVNLPVVHWSVNWWNTLHQGQTVFAKGGPKLAPVFLTPLLLMGLAYMAAFGALLLVRTRGEVWRRRAEAALSRLARA